MKIKKIAFIIISLTASGHCLASKNNNKTCKEILSTIKSGEFEKIRVKYNDTPSPEMLEYTLDFKNEHKTVNLLASCGASTGSECEISLSTSGLKKTMYTVSGFRVIALDGNFYFMHGLVITKDAYLYSTLTLTQINLTSKENIFTCSKR